MSRPGANKHGDDLHRSRAGDREALNRLFQTVYDELYAVAHNLMRGERVDHTLQPTALINEVYVRLLGSARLSWADRVHFRRIAARTMRRVLVDHAKSKKAEKRGGERRGLPLHELANLIAADRGDVDHSVVSEAIDALAGIDKERAEILEMHYYGDLTGDQIARILGLGARTVDNRLKTAHNWIRDYLEKDGDDQAGSPLPG